MMSDSRTEADNFNGTQNLFLPGSVETIADHRRFIHKVEMDNFSHVSN